MYDHLFFDADGTLFDFMAAEKWALSQVFEEVGIPANDDAIATYSRINNGVWLEFEQGLLSMDRLKTERFKRFFSQYGVSKDAERTARQYTSKLSQSYHLFDDSMPVLESLKARGIPMSLITNGISMVQRGRLEATGTRKYFSAIIISEEIGIQKPHPSYFTKAIAMAKASGKPAENPLVIGDSPSSDIKGGIDAGLDTCWINRFGMTANPEIRATYEVENLIQLLELLDNLN
jgi:YjjG family noncanonical pyrimidine nucleotidase